MLSTAGQAPRTFSSLVRTIALLGAAVATSLVMAESAALASTWGSAEPVPFASGSQYTPSYGLANSVSCPTPGNCAVVGQFKDSSGNWQGYTLMSTNGTWSTPQLVSFASGVQSVSPDSAMTGVWCVSVGNCTAAGSFRNTTNGHEAFTVTSSGGVWGTAEPVSFAAGVQNTAPSAYVGRVWCASAGNCTVVGKFRNAAGGHEAFTVSSSGGVWGTAAPVVFASGVQHPTPNATMWALSCVSAGNCTAGGTFQSAAGYTESYTVSSSGGVWGTAEPVVFAAGVHNTALWNLTCASAGNCTAVGEFTNTTGGAEAFTVSSSGGVWGTAAPVVFASGVQNTSPNAKLGTISCTSVGNCTAGGWFKNATGAFEAFTVSSSGGVWGTAVPLVFAAGVQNTTPDAKLYTLSCASAGSCTGVGEFKNAAGGNEAFTVSSSGGVWGTAVPAVFAAGVQNTTPDAKLYTLSCASAGSCTAVGQFENAAGGTEAFTMSVFTEAAPTTTTVPTSSDATAVPNLPATGSNATAALVVGALCVLVGGMIVVRRRRLTSTTC